MRTGSGHFLGHRPWCPNALGGIPHSEVTWKETTPAPAGAFHPTVRTLEADAALRLLLTWGSPG